ncbi:transglutaminase-like cysteine peptidase [Jeongeupella avenae]|uniref:Transglutaminase-like cysteine peptidase n=2 Tax=Antarcticirhabdus aurantiaca TaxID=2606717 RepID=A0ACD4NXL3_9HYPH|nr:transglutaminase-like cysteine peptidase [Antarcticirhabdus aurantiaca]WAJ31464.1 transglutaminase-like cysteine peptidase [Jeongeuplla avenae]
MVLTVCGVISAPPAQAGTPMPTAGPTSQPVGHHDFCGREPARCRANDVRAVVKLTPAVWQTLQRVNYLANVRIEPRTDEEMHGVPELWSYPTIEGDCEDYVLYKQRELENGGLPASALLVTVVRQPNGDGHAVLTVRTNQGDFILDNLDDRVLAWDVTPYTYLKRQSQAHAGRWVTVEDVRDLLVGSVR